MSVLLIGGCGFIGKYITASLAKKDIPTIVFDRNANPLMSTEKFIFVRGDFYNRLELESVIRDYGVTSVIHLVHSTIPQSSNDNPEFDATSNIGGTLVLLDLCVKYLIRKIVFLSSGGSVYGTSESTLIDENHPTNPISSYGITKLTIEKYLGLFHQIHGLSYIAIRAGNPYGITDKQFRKNGIIPIFIRQMVENKSIHIFGDGEIIRDYFHVCDLADLCRIAVFSDYCGVLNAGSGIGTSINQLVSLISRTVRMTPKIIQEERRNFDPPCIILDCRKALKYLHWKPSISLKEGILDITNCEQSTEA